MPTLSVSCIYTYVSLGYPFCQENLLLLTIFEKKIRPCTKQSQNFFYIINSIILSTINTAAHANNATVRRLFSRYAKISATISPAAPEMIPPAVAVRSCRKCHSSKTCIWHIVQKGFTNGLVISLLKRTSGSIRIRYVTPAITRIYRYTFGFISVCCLLFLCFFFLNRAEMCCQPCYQQCRDNDHKSGRNFIQYRNHCK